MGMHEVSRMPMECKNGALMTCPMPGPPPHPLQARVVEEAAALPVRRRAWEATVAVVAGAVATTASPRRVANVACCAGDRSQSHQVDSTQ